MVPLRQYQRSKRPILHDLLFCQTINYRQQQATRDYTRTLRTVHRPSFRSCLAHMVRVDSSRSPGDDMAEKVSAARWLADAEALLTPKQAQALRLTLGDNMTFAAAAKLIGCSNKTAKVFTIAAIRALEPMRPFDDRTV